APSVPDAQYGPGAGVSPFGSSTGITLKNGGALQLVDGAAATVDLVGMVGVPAEGTPLPKFDGRGTHTFERLLGGAAGSCVDTGNNIADFHYRLVQGPQGLGVITPCL
ncbi:MAG: hypothetical protein HKN01_07085, partial [Acidimicrobiia bacterium]|nr:hypothetical protein [Acidimicrobiia bacterium]